MSKNKYLIKVISIILVLALMLSSTFTGSITAFAETSSNATKSTVTEEDIAYIADNKSPETAEPYVLGEDTTKRRENEKHFLMSDGTYIAAMYDTAVHYVNESGDYEQIDNSLELVGEEYQTKKSKHKIKLANKASSKKLVTLQTDDYKISWGFDDVLKVRGEPMQSDKLTGENAEFAVANINSKMRYVDAFENIDLEYIISPDSIKENIILKSNLAQNTFIINYDVGKLVARQKDKRTIDLLDGKKVKYTISAPVMYDAVEQISAEITITLDKQEDGILTVILSADSQWLKSSKRVYPVTVDPEIITSQTSSSLDSKFTFTANPNNISNIDEVYAASNQTFCGWDSVLGDMTSLYRFNTLPTLANGDYITNAVFALAGHEIVDFDITLHECVEQWGYNTNYAINYEPAYSEEVIDYYVPSSGIYQWNITNLVRRWYQLGTVHLNNAGFMLRSDSSPVTYVAFISPQNATTNARPALYISYVNHTGVENYLSYSTANLGFGTAYVNNATGNLTVEAPLLSTKGANMPASVVLYYNGSNITENSKNKVGLGWRMNYDQRLDYVSNAAIRENGYYYIYTDSDGTKHYMKKDGNEYKDEIGAGLKLKLVNNIWYLTDKENNTCTFNSGGRLTSIRSATSSSVITITHNANGRISSITDGSGDVITIVRNSDDAVTALIDAYDREIQLTYSNSKLVGITGFDGTTINLTYTNMNHLETVTSAYNLQTKFEYLVSECPAWESRVTTITDISEPNASSNRTDGDKLFIMYTDEGFTEITDTNINISYIVFDNLGRATNSFANTGATSQTYTTASVDNATYVNNKIARTTGTATPTDNKAKNNSFESTDNWYSWSSNSSTASASLSQESVRLGNKALKLTSSGGAITYYQKYTPTSSGKYTYSVYYKTNGVTAAQNNGISVYIAKVSTDGTTTYYRSQVVTHSTDGDWLRLSITADINITNLKEIHIINSLKDATGTVYFDSAQLEYSETAGEYNMLYNGNFENGTDGWSTNVAATTEGVKDIGSVICAGNQPEGFKKSLVLMGHRAYQKYAVQTVEINQPASKVALNFSAYAHGLGVKTGGGNNFALDLNFKYSDGTNEYVVRSFNIYNWSWQFLTELITPSKANMSKTVTQVRALVLYYGQANYAEITGVQLTVDTTGAMYTYDEKGNPISAVDTENNAVNSQYDAQDRIVSKTMQDGSVYTSNYGSDTSNRLPLSTTGPKNQKTDYTYNSYGQVTSTSIYNSTESNGRKITSSNIYSNDGKYLESQIDSLGSQTDYVYDDYDRLSTTYYDDEYMNYLSYTYDNADRLKSMAQMRNGLLTSFVNVSYTYTNNRLTKIRHNSTDYLFNYDKFGNTTGIYVKSRPLITNTYSENDYNPNNDYLDTTTLLSRSTYGNGDYVEYDYDRYGRVVEKKVNGAVKHQYQYNASGNIDKLVDYENNTVYNYYYDGLGRLKNIYCTNKFGVTYKYDGSNRITKKTYNLDGTTKSTSFTYSDGGYLNSAEFANGSTRLYTYDSLARLSTVSTKTSASATQSWQTIYGYYNPTNTTTTALVNSLTHQKIGLNLSYTYDNYGNIITVSENGVLKVSYEYDNIHELTRENNAYLNKTITYEYDNGGNILSKTYYNYTTGSLENLTGNVVQYTYNDSEWKDLLTAYNGNTITYDAIGNPLTYYNGTSFTWSSGRSLTGLTTAGGANITYKYNEGGIRTSKTVNGTQTYYYLDGSDIIAQKTGNNTYWFEYDAAGNRHSITYNGATYYYYYNLQGDVIGLYDANLNVVVNYTYDSWGKVLSVTGSMASTLGQDNPFRYRGYYYDSDTGLYYLNSRYYDPEIGRFLNADGYLSTGQGVLSHNMFAYCNNNPIMYIDPTGHSFESFIKQLTIEIKIVIAVGMSVLDKTIVHFSSQMDVCTDGAIADLNQDERHPYGDGDHQNSTAKTSNLYSDTTNYMVIPLRCKNYEQLLGCVGVIINNKTGDYVYAIVGDLGPPEGGGGYGLSAWDEVSIHAAWKLNGHETGTPIGGTRQYGNFTYIIFPNSKRNWKYGVDMQSQIDTVGAKYWR